MTRTDKVVGAAVAVLTILTLQAAHAQVPAVAGRTTASAIAMRSTTSAARAASALSTLGSGSSVASARATSIMGYLWSGDGSAVNNATVQLRNIVTGQIEQVSTTLENGAFAFNNVGGGTYTIEYVAREGGRLIAVGQAFSVAPGETVATFVRLGSRLVAIVPDLASNAAQAAVSAAASAGVPGIVPPSVPASATQ